MKNNDKSNPSKKNTRKFFTEEELDKILEEKRNATSCNRQFPDCPAKPNDISCLNCPLYKKNL